VRYGYRRIHVLLQREGWSVNHKRVYRLYVEEGLHADQEQLRSLSCVARRLWEGDVAAHLRSATDAGRLYNVLVSDVWSGLGVPERDMRFSGT
jgi:transposase InsO family protein